MRILVTGAGGFVGRALVRRWRGAHQLVVQDSSCDAIRHDADEIIEGDICDSGIQAEALGNGVDALVHLATVPGGAAEADPDVAWRVNVEASQRLIGLAAKLNPRLRVIFASSIAVFGEPLPEIVDDAQPLRPRLLYGAHKAIIEAWLGTLARRGELQPISIRLPGIVARPQGPSGMKSAFMSEIFHSALAGEPFTSPIGPGASMWLMSLSTIIDNICVGIELAPEALAEPFAITLPALRVTMRELAGEIARQTGSSCDRIIYAPDVKLERDFGCYPILRTPMADKMGFRSDGSVSQLVTNALGSIREEV